jgi:hypothetical protein
VVLRRQERGGLPNFVIAFSSTSMKEEVFLGQKFSGHWTFSNRRDHTDHLIYTSSFTVETQSQRGETVMPKYSWTLDVTPKVRFELSLYPDLCLGFSKNTTSPHLPQADLCSIFTSTLLQTQHLYTYSNPQQLPT